MPVLHSPESAYSQEMRKHEAQHSQFGPPGRPYVKRDFPMMMHKASSPSAIAETVIAADEKDADYHWHQGFRPTPQEAFAALDRTQFEAAELHAEIEYEKKNTLMSDGAKRDVERAEDAAPGHLASVPVTPIKPRARQEKE